MRWIPQACRQLKLSGDNTCSWSSLHGYATARGKGPDLDLDLDLEDRDASFGLSAN